MVMSVPMYLYKVMTGNTFLAALCPDHMDKVLGNTLLAPRLPR